MESPGNLRARVDAIGKSQEERFREIREYFMECLSLWGGGRRELYNRPRLGDAREPTEEDLVRRWAGTLTVSVNDICIGIQRGFAAAADRKCAVTSFRYLNPHIVARCAELRESQAGIGPVSQRGIRRQQ
jgi:hypothetical protein